jgi:hypothetical protein
MEYPIPARFIQKKVPFFWYMPCIDLHVLQFADHSLHQSGGIDDTESAVAEADRRPQFAALVALRVDRNVTYPFAGMEMSLE